MKQQKHCLVVLSGGQDSITCLGVALKSYASVSAIHFRYRQKHTSPEYNAVCRISHKHGVPLKVVDMDNLLQGLVDSALLDSGPVREVGKPHPSKPGLPSSFVPGRNALFLTLAHAYAQTVGAIILMTGVCETDYSGYPDCRDEFIRSMDMALNIGYQTDIRIVTPLMHLGKAATFHLAEEVSILEDVLEISHTCYNGVHDDANRHPWGYGCGECPACLLRKAGYEEFLQNKNLNLHLKDE